MTGESNIKDVLMISPWIPDKTGFGSQKRCAMHLSVIASLYRVHLIIFTHTPINSAALPESIKAICASIQIIPVAPPHSPSGIFRLPLAATLREFVQPSLYRINTTDDALRKAVDALHITKFHIAFCFRIPSAVLLGRLMQLTSISAERTVVDFDDIESISLSRAQKFTHDGFEKAIISKIYLRRLIKFENYLLQTYDDVLVCSDDDRKVIQNRDHRATIHTIPNSVPLQPAPQVLQDRDVLNILFVGIMTYGPNRDGVIWFCRDILPLIRNQTKIRCGVSLVGFDPQADIQALASLDSVIVTGGVESVRPYYENCDLVIAPIRYGAGTRIKILEAMSFQKPVVSTTIGAEGIDVEDGRNILLGDNPDAFARACVELLESAAMRQSMGREGRKCVEEKYSESVVAEKLNQLLTSQLMR